MRGNVKSEPLNGGEGQQSEGFTAGCKAEHKQLIVQLYLFS